MKNFAVVVLAIVVGLALFVYLKPGAIDTVRQLSGTANKTTTVYKWQDKHGAWHVTNSPPPAGTPFQKQEYLSDTNILPAPAQDKK